MISYTVALQNEVQIRKKLYKSGPANLLLDKIYSTDAFDITCLSLSQMNHRHKEQV